MHKLTQYLHNQNLGILLIRIALGVVFIHAGWLKITGMDVVVAGFGAIGIPTALAYIVAYAEFIGGIALILGIFVRSVSVVLAVIMVVAIAKVHFASGFGLQNGGYEYTFVLLLGSLAMITFGAGAYSIGRLLKK